MSTLYVGDVHGQFHYLKKAIRFYEPNQVYQVGDLGVWPGSPAWDSLTGFDVPVYFCDGNHENFPAIVAGAWKEKHNLFYLPRFTQLENTLFVGGANSIDKVMRTPGHDWFPEETIKSVPSVLPEVRFVVSHTCPERVFQACLASGMSSDRDPSRKALDAVWDTVKPTRWFFGHFHQTITSVLDGCAFYGLHRLDLPGSHGFHKPGAILVP